MAMDLRKRVWLERSSSIEEVENKLDDFLAECGLLGQFTIDEERSSITWEVKYTVAKRNDQAVAAAGATQAGTQHPSAQPTAPTVGTEHSTHPG